MKMKRKIKFSLLLAGCLILSLATGATGISLASEESGGRRNKMNALIVNDAVFQNNYDSKKENIRSDLFGNLVSLKNHSSERLQTSQSEGGCFSIV